MIFQENVISELNYTYVNFQEDLDCARNVKLGEPGQFPFIFLASFPGSGNTWIRMLIEDASGFYTGSKYDETALYNKGFIGELEDPLAGTTICAKNHGRSLIEYAKGVIILVRNPYDAILAEFNRKHGHARAHVGTADPELFNTPLWDETSAYMTHRWASMHQFYSIIKTEEHVPVHILFFDDLQRNSTHEMEKILKFLNDNFGFYPKDAGRRLECLSKMNSETFHRKKTAVDMSIYDDDKRRNLNHRIQMVNIFFARSNLPSLPNYFKPTLSNEPFPDDVITEDEITNTTDNQLFIIKKIHKFGSDRSLRKSMRENS